MRPSISVIINTRNEEKNLPYALRSVCSWVDEVIVVDMQSTDETQAIARSFGAKVFTVEPAGFVEPARAFAVSQACGDWILVLDADEVIPEPLSRRLRAVASDGPADIVAISRKTFMLGVALQATGWGDDVQRRFFRRGTLDWSARIHSLPAPSAGARAMELHPGVDADLAIWHFSYLGFDDFVERLNRYTSIEAQQARERGEAPSELRGFALAVREIVGRYVFARGFRDGWRGLYLSFLMAGYRLLASAKLRQLDVVGDNAEIRRAYAAQAEKLLAHYGPLEQRVEDAPTSKEV
jgi:glycosyltransferase involved in cell wall biosynthesis